MNTYVIPLSAPQADLTTIGGKGMNSRVSNSL
jgi:hypothetical protein